MCGNVGKWNTTVLCGLLIYRRKIFLFCNITKIGEENGAKNYNNQKSNKGDLERDYHHTVENWGIVLGEAIKKVIGEKKAIKRYESAILPMDEALVLCAIDLSGRPYLFYDVQHREPRIGTMDLNMIHEFFYAVSYSASMNLHIRQLYGVSNHHIAESSFKAFGKALDMAIMHEERLNRAV